MADLPDLFVQLKSFVFWFAVIYFGLIGILFFQQRNFIYHPDNNMPDKNTLGIADRVTDVHVTAQDGQALSGWYIPPATSNKPTLLFFHGNAGNISHRLFKIAPYMYAGYGILLAEYRGYGRNDGKPTEDGLYMDGRAYYEWLTSQGTKGENIILYGESLGSGVAVQLATEQTIGAMILETPYASLAEPAQRTYFFIPFIEMLMHDKFRSIDKIGTLDIPKLFIIAGRDEVLSPETGMRLYEAAPEPKTLALLEHAGHNNAYNHGADKEVLKFLSNFD